MYCRLIALCPPGNVNQNITQYKNTQIQCNLYKIGTDGTPPCTKGFIKGESVPSLQYC